MTELKRRRTEKNMTQGQLAAAVGVNQNTISNWESGFRKPNIIMLIKLAKIFECTADELLVDIEEKEV